MSYYDFQELILFVIGSLLIVFMTFYAFRNKRLKTKRVYIAGPISKGDLAKNIEQANIAFFELMDQGFAPLCPQWSCYSGEITGSAVLGYYSRAEVSPRKTTHEDWIGIDLPWVEVSDAVLRLPGESVGADKEVEHAKNSNIPVFYNIFELLNWRDGLA